METTVKLPSAEQIAAEIARHHREARLLRKVLRAIKHRDSVDAIANQLRESHPTQQLRGEVSHAQ